jgi:hypothetical protein
MKKMIVLAAIVVVFVAFAFVIFTERERPYEPDQNAESEWEDYRLVGSWTKTNQPFYGLITQFTKDGKVFDSHVNGGREEYKYHLKGDKLLYYLSDGSVVEGKLLTLTNDDLEFTHPYRIRFIQETWAMKRVK